MFEALAPALRLIGPPLWPEHVQLLIDVRSVCCSLVVSLLLLGLEGVCLLKKFVVASADAFLFFAMVRCCYRRFPTRGYVLGFFGFGVEVLLVPTVRCLVRVYKFASADLVPEPPPLSTGRPSSQALARY